MAETTRTTSGTPTQNTSTQAGSTPASPGGARNTSSPPSTSTPSSTSTTATPASSGGARNASNPSSTSSGSPAATTTTASPGGAATTGANQGANQGQRPQSQQQGQRPQSQQQGQRPAQGQQNQQTQGQQTQGQQGQGQRQGNQGESRDGEHHVELSGNAMSDAKRVGSELVGAARDSAVSLIDAQRARAADQITALGDALRRSAESFESTGAGGLVEYANQAADQISGFADTVRDRSWNELAGDLESFGRRYPMTFMASAMSIGFVLGRFLLSSSERTHQAGIRGAGFSGGRVSDTRREAGGASRTAQSGARAEYGSSSI